MKQHGIEYLNGQIHPDTGQPLQGETWNVGYGCRGCEQDSACWALGQIPRQAQNCPESRETWEHSDTGLRWTGKWVSLPERLERPLHWHKSRMIAVQFMGDVALAPPEYFAAVLGVIAATPQHMYLMLSKWPEVIQDRFAWLDDYACENGLISEGIRDANMALHWTPGAHTDGVCPTCGYFCQVVCDDYPPPWPLPNLILGTSACTQATLVSRWRELAQIPARWRVVSLTPREPLDLGWIMDTIPPGCGNPIIESAFPDLVIFDGSSGHSAWSTDLAWARSLRNECRTLNIPFRLKQLGSSPISWSCSDPAGADPSEWPEDLRVREWLW